MVASMVRSSVLDYAESLLGGTEAISFLSFDSAFLAVLRSLTSLLCSKGPTFITNCLASLRSI
jgi:hypothetical protein